MGISCQSVHLNFIAFISTSTKWIDLKFGIQLYKDVTKVEVISVVQYQLAVQWGFNKQNNMFNFMLKISLRTQFVSEKENQSFHGYFRVPNFAQ